MRRRKKPDLGVLLDRCLAAFVQAGTLDLSLDQLARKAGSSKRMLVHYFGGARTSRTRRLRARKPAASAICSQAFPPGATMQACCRVPSWTALCLLNREVCLLVMDLSKRAWSGSKRARLFYAEQQRLWIELLMRYLPDRPAVEDVLQAFQGAVLAFLVTGDREPGRRAVMRILENQEEVRSHA